MAVRDQLLEVFVDVSPPWLVHEPTGLEVVALGGFAEIGAGYKGAGLWGFGISNHNRGVGGSARLLNAAGVFRYRSPVWQVTARPFR